VNLDDLKDKFEELFGQVKNSVEENSLYNTLRERYETLSSSVQKAIVMGCCSAVLFIILLIPWSFISSSNDFITEFEDHRTLIRGLLKTRSLPKGIPLPKGMTAANMVNRVKGWMHQAGLLETQIGDTQLLPKGEPQSQLTSPNTKQQGMKIQLKQLNLRQIMDIGYHLQNMDSSVKVTGLEIQATSKNPHYFNALFKLISYSLPEPEKKSSKKKSRRKRKGT